MKRPMGWVYSRPLGAFSWTDRPAISWNLRRGIEAVALKVGNVFSADTPTGQTWSRQNERETGIKY